MLTKKGVVDIPRLVALLRRPLFWVACYMLLIPIFALAYMKMGRDFYHTTAQFESGRNRNAGVVLDDFKNAIINSYHSTTGTYEVKSHGWIGDIRQIALNALQVNGDAVQFELYTQLYFKRGAAVAAQSNITYVVKTGILRDQIVTGQPGSSSVIFEKLISVSKNKGSSFDPRVLFPGQPLGGVAASGALFVPIPMWPRVT